MTKEIQWIHSYLCIDTKHYIHSYMDTSIVCITEISTYFNDISTK